MLLSTESWELHLHANGWVGAQTGHIGSTSAATCSARRWARTGCNWTPLLFELVEFLETLAALTPGPAINLILYHGVLPARALAS